MALKKILTVVLIFSPGFLLAEFNIKNIQVYIDGAPIEKDYELKKNDKLTFLLEYNDVPPSGQNLFWHDNNKLEYYNIDGNKFIYTVSEKDEIRGALSLSFSLGEGPPGYLRKKSLSNKIQMDVKKASHSKVSEKKIEVLVNGQDKKAANDGDNVTVNVILEDQYNQTVFYTLIVSSIYSSPHSEAPKNKGTKKGERNMYIDSDGTTYTWSYEEASSKDSQSNSITFPIDERFKGASKAIVTIYGHNNDSNTTSKYSFNTPSFLNEVDYYNRVEIPLNKKVVDNKDKKVMDNEDKKRIISAANEPNMVTINPGDEVIRKLCGTNTILHYLKTIKKDLKGNNTATIGITDEKCEVYGYFDSKETGTVSPRDIKVRSVGRFYELPSDIKTADDLINYLEGNTIIQEEY